MKKKAVIYCRVSTKEQVEEGNSLVTQERQCIEYAKKHGYEIVATFIEQGESAKTTDRTELKKLIGFCSSKKNDISAIIAYKIDRISRNTDDYSQIRIILKRYGVEIKSTSEFFEDTPAGRFMENIIANVAQFDNDVRTERSVAGMKEAVREGRYVWLAPYGYSNVKVNGKGTIAPNDKAKFVLKAFTEVSKQVYNINIIRQKLIAEGMVGSNGKPISKTSFSDLLRNELYAGWINKFGERCKGMFEPIISEELFIKVQRTLKNKYHGGTLRQSDCKDFPLRRLFKHPSGRVLTGCWCQGRKKKYPYYLVHGTKINIRKEVLENVFMDWLNTYFKLNSHFFEQLLEMATKFTKLEVENLGKNEAILNKQIQQLQIKQDIIVEKNIAGVISDTLCQQKLEEIENQLYDLKNRVLQLENINRFDYLRLLKLTRDILLNPASAWENARIDEKIRLQWFYFPNGIEFDGLCSRTTKVCRLYKVKSSFFPFNSGVGDYPDSKLNTDNEQSSLPWRNLVIEDSASTKNDITEMDVIKELESLEEIFLTNTTNKT